MPVKGPIPAGNCKPGVKTLPASAAQGARITWFAPAKAPAGSNTTVVFTGANFGPNAALEATGEGIAAMAVKVNSTRKSRNVCDRRECRGGNSRSHSKYRCWRKQLRQIQITGRSQTGSLRKKIETTGSRERQSPLLRLLSGAVRLIGCAAILAIW